MPKASPTTLAARESYPDWSLLTTWVAVVDSKSVSAAATLLGISQAAVSQRIKLLEASLETSLLDRSTRPAKPTTAGERLFEHATQLLQRADEMVEGVRNLSRAKRHIVRFGCVDSFAATIGPTLIRGLSGASRQIRLWSGLTPVLDSLLENRQLDIAVTTSSVSSRPGIKRQTIFTEPYLLVLPKDFDLSGCRSFGDIARRLQFIRYSSRSVIGQDVDRYLEGLGEFFERSYEFDATDPLLSLVSEGLGFALTTPLCIWQSRHLIPTLQVLPVSRLRAAGDPYPVLTRTFYMAYRENEMGKLPGEARDVMLMAWEKMVARQMGPAMGLASSDMWVELS
ncbi:LysR family transcriptional regulator [Pigmentiphaga aceris]|uniref:LysR family transcriptional regulator n=1 Tax=Pigmentiphaga aceris TaxID=1940612 RepID=A0A5C0ARK6_9BURK|nr:LysR family transcriptional regulator [Pigmentiphaga aceris]QEI04749.1 LysR family transcriptional regulator [Pigmentiphaga aceris]